MPCRTARGRLVLLGLGLLACLLALTAPAQGQLVRWLRLNPENLTTLDVAVEMHLGTRSARVVAFQRTRRSAISAARFVGADGEQRLEAQIADQEALIVSLKTDTLARGPGWVVIDLEKETREWTVQRWRAFLEAEGLTDPAPARAQAAQKVRVEGHVFLKALVHRGNSERGKAVVSPVGQELELVPLADPVGLRGNMLPVRLLHRGKPMPGAVVHAAATDAPAEWAGTTDAKGEALVPLPAVGTYVMSSTVLESRAEGSGVDVVFATSSVTLQRR